VYVTNSSKYALLPVSEMDSSLDTYERMTANFGKDSFEFDVYVISDEKQLSMTVFNEFGTTIASLFYDGVSLDFNSSVFPENLKAEYIIADFQFCLYKSESLKKELSKIGLDLTISSHREKDGKSIIEKRILSKKGKKISEITKCYRAEENGERGSLLSIHYDNILRGYSYTLNGVSE